MAFLLETILLGLSNLRLRMLRSVLTALGIIFGVAAVIIMSSLGEGSKRQALAQIERLGARNIIVRSQKPPESQGQQSSQRQGWLSRFGITRGDLDVVRENFEEAEAIDLSPRPARSSHNSRTQFSSRLTLVLGAPGQGGS